MYILLCQCYSNTKNLERCIYKINSFDGIYPVEFDGYIYIYIGKSVPLQAWSGPEGSRKLRFPDYMTRAQDGGKVVSLTQRPPLPPGNAPGTHFC